MIIINQRVYLDLCSTSLSKECAVPNSHALCDLDSLQQFGGQCPNLSEVYLHCIMSLSVCCMAVAACLCIYSLGPGVDWEYSKYTNNCCRIFQEL